MILDKNQPKLDVLVVSLDVPFPDDYGGAKDIWAQISLLLSVGWRVDLVATYLNKKRRETFSASRKENLFGHAFLLPRLPLARCLFSVLPYDMVSRRIGDDDLARISEALGSKSYDVIIVEGLQSILTFESLRPHLRYKKAVLRVQNIESDYYKNQYHSEPNPVKAFYYRIESEKYNQFCKKYFFAGTYDAIFNISTSEMGHPIFKGMKEQHFVPPFVDLQVERPVIAGRKNRFLYVGNLNLPDNRLALKQSHKYLKNLTGGADIEYLVCGKCESSSGLGLLQRDASVTFAFNASSDELKRAYDSSKIFVNFSANAAGVKLKLLDALSHGLPVLSNRNGCAGSGLEGLVINVDDMTPRAVGDTIHDLFSNEKAWLEHSAKVTDTVERFLVEQKKNFLKKIIT